MHHSPRNRNATATRVPGVTGPVREVAFVKKLDLVA